MGGYSVANAKLSFTTADEKWSASVFVNNMFDRHYRVQQFSITGDPLFFADGFLGLVEEYYGKPRWVGGSISYNF